MENGQKYKQLFVGGDLSGIQKFLYSISSKKAAISLKGRSSYLRQYMEEVCDELKSLAEKAGAVSAKNIYCSGGKFYLITDASEAIAEAIDQYVSAAQEALWKEHMGQLALHVCYVPFTENADGTVDVDGQKNLNPGALWEKVNVSFAMQKSQKFKHELTTRYAEFFTPIPVGGATKVCVITGVESPDCVTFEGMDVLPSVKKQMLLGENLRESQDFKTFEDYAGATDLGVLRMDVDGLGKRFIDGFASIRQYQEFSARLTDYFEKEVEKMQQESAFRDYLNLIYAGGDDLFVVGRWDKVIEFAERVHRGTAARFSGEGITISGGMAIVNPKFPIAKAAEMAGEAEAKAKSFVCAEGASKNAFCMFGKTVSWKDEFDYVKAYKDRFVRLISDYQLSKGILHKLMLYAAVAERNRWQKEHGKPENFSYVWHLSYYLARYKKRYEKNDEVQMLCNQLKDKNLFQSNDRQLELVALAARWAEQILKDNLN